MRTLSNHANHSALKKAHSKKQWNCQASQQYKRPKQRNPRFGLANVIVHQHNPALPFKLMSPALSVPHSSSGGSGGCMISVFTGPYWEGVTFLHILYAIFDGKYFPPECLTGRGRTKTRVTRFSTANGDARCFVTRRTPSNRSLKRESKATSSGKQNETKKKTR